MQLGPLGRTLAPEAFDRVFEDSARAVVPVAGAERVRELDLQLEIARKTLALNDETVTYFRNRLDGGVANRLELDRIVALRQDTAAAIPELQRQAATIENLLSLLAGRLPGSITRTGLTIAEQLPPPIPPAHRPC